MSYGERNMVNVERTLAQELPTDEPLGALEPVAYFNGAMPTGVTVSHKGRIFVNFPKWGDDVSFTVAEIRKGEMVAYPDESINQTNPADQAVCTCFRSVSRCRSGRPPMDSRYWQTHYSSRLNTEVRN